MITVARACFSTRISTRENSALSSAPGVRFRKIGCATSVFAAMVNTETSLAKSRIRATITSSLSEIGLASKAESRANETPANGAELSVNEWRSATTAVPS